MRSIVSVFSGLVVAGMLLFAPAAPMLAEGISDAERFRREVLTEWYKLADKRTEFEVSDPDQVPNQLALAAAQSGCRYKDEIGQAPIRFMKLDSRRLAIVFCPDIIGSHRVFDLSDLRKPTLVKLPFSASPSGFGTTDSPGWITWDKDAGVFQAETGSDISSRRVRHTYRFDGYSYFVLLRVELGQRGANEWTTLWDAPQWSIPKSD